MPDEAQPAVSQAVQVVDYFLNAAAVVDAKCWLMFLRGRHIVEHYRNAALVSSSIVRDPLRRPRQRDRPRGGRSSGARWPLAARGGSRYWPSPLHSRAAWRRARWFCRYRRRTDSEVGTITPMVLLFPPARLRACRLGDTVSSSMAFITRLRVEVLTTLALFSTRETVAVETFARRATCSRFMAVFPIVTLTRQLTEFNLRRGHWEEARSTKNGS